MKKFDIIIGNPPYNDTVIGAGRGGTSGGNPVLYRRFVDKAFALVRDGGMVAMAMLRTGIEYAHKKHGISYYNPDTSKHWHYAAGWFVAGHDKVATNVAANPIIRKVYDITAKLPVQTCSASNHRIFNHKVPGSRHVIIETPNGRDVPATRMGYVIGNMIEDGPKLIYKQLNTVPSYIATTYPHIVENTHTIRFETMGAALAALKFIKNHAIIYYLNDRLHEKAMGNFYRYLKPFDHEQIIKGTEYPVEWKLTPEEIEEVESTPRIWRTVNVAANN